MNLREDCSFLYNQYVQQICFGLYDLQLRFHEPTTSISTGSEVIYYPKNGDAQKWNGTNGRDSFSMNNILEIPVIGAFLDKTESLNIYFENGDKIKIVADSDGYESYIVHNNRDFEVIY